ncbi:MAG: hypothetical protein GXP55_16980 [Deltaproteobacteria bacterium]|nr:hypothetical protein [Deltaproteobacteria bacterium]
MAELGFGGARALPFGLALALAWAAHSPASAQSAEQPPPPDVPTSSPAAEDAAPAVVADPVVRLRLSVGAGRLQEAKALDRSAYGGFGLGVDLFPAAGLMLSLDAGLDYYSRRYQTNRPAGASGGLLAVSGREHRLRGSLRVGYDVLDAAGVSRLDGVLTPYLMASLDEFVNDPIPQSLLYVGGGLQAMVRVSDALRLSADVRYGYAVSNNHQAVQDALLFGPVKGVLGYGGGLWIVLPPHALLGLTYRGEWVANETSRRFLNGAELTLGFEL